MITYSKSLSPTSSEYHRQHRHNPAPRYYRGLNKNAYLWNMFTKTIIGNAQAAKEYQWKLIGRRYPKLSALSPKL